MAGALIVRGTRPPTTTANGDLDTLLKPIPSQPFTERVHGVRADPVCLPRPRQRTTSRPIRTAPTPASRPRSAVSRTMTSSGPAAGPHRDASPASTAPCSVTSTMRQAGKVERWRMIHGGVRDTITLQFRKLAPNATPPGKLLAAAGAGLCRHQLHRRAADLSSRRGRRADQGGRDQDERHGVPAGLSLGCPRRVPRARRLLHHRRRLIAVDQHQRDAATDADSRHRACRRHAGDQAT